MRLSQTISSYRQNAPDRTILLKVIRLFLTHDQLILADVYGQYIDIFPVILTGSSPFGDEFTAS